MKKGNTIITIFVLYILVNMLLFPSIYLQQTFNGITAWAFNVLPSVLPFMFFTKILSNSNLIEKFSIFFQRPFRVLYKTPAISSYVFLISIISGYPVGAKITADLYENGKITKEDAFKMTSFCSTSGPMFIIGAVGIGMLKNATFGYIILVSHILGAILNGIIYRSVKIKSDFLEKNVQKIQKNSDLSDIILDCALSIISVGVIIVIFFVIITSLSPIFSFFPNNIACILEGIIEITKSCLDISKSISGTLQVIACSFIISFGGISTILQSLTMLKKLNMPPQFFILQKITHAVFACAISSILVLFI